VGSVYTDPILVCAEPICGRVGSKPSPFVRELQAILREREATGIQLEAPLRMTLERAIEFIDIDEYVEATPTSLRLRKRILDATARKRAAAAAA
jgi:hypothetical protein